MDIHYTGELSDSFKTSTYAFFAVANPSVRVRWIESSRPPTTTPLFPQSHSSCPPSTCPSTLAMPASEGRSILLTFNQTAVLLTVCFQVLGGTAGATLQFYLGHHTASTASVLHVLLSSLLISLSAQLGFTPETATRGTGCIRCFGEL